MVASGGDSEVNRGSSFVRNRLYSAAMVNILKHTTAKIPEKRLSPSGVEYKCELEPLWMAADLVERAQMGHVHIRSYENGLIRVGRLKTLRVRKRKFSQMEAC